MTWVSACTKRLVGNSLQCSIPPLIKVFEMVSIHIYDTSLFVKFCSRFLCDIEWQNVFLYCLQVRSPTNVLGKGVHGNLQDLTSWPAISESTRGKSHSNVICVNARFLAQITYRYIWNVIDQVESQQSKRLIRLSVWSFTKLSVL